MGHGAAPGGGRGGVTEASGGAGGAREASRPLRRGPTSSGASRTIHRQAARPSELCAPAAQARRPGSFPPGSGPAWYYRPARELPRSHRPSARRPRSPRPDPARSAPTQPQGPPAAALVPASARRGLARPSPARRSAAGCGRTACPDWARTAWRDTSGSSPGRAASPRTA